MRAPPTAPYTGTLGSSNRPANRRTLEDSDVFVAFLCLYLITASRTPPLSDALPMWQAAESLVRHGSLAIETRWPVNAPPGPSGHYYPVAPLLACLVHVPGALVQRVIEALAPTRAPALVVVTSQLGPLLLGALTSTLFFRLLKRLGYDLRQAAWATLLLGAGTSVWVYAHRPYAEIVQVTCFVMFLGALLRAAEDGTRECALRLGLTMALLVNAKNVYFVCLPGAALYLFLRLRAKPGALRRVGAFTIVGLAPGLIALAIYNHLRWGSVAMSGYESITKGLWNGSLFEGLWGQLFSPGKSVFLFSPPLILALFGARRFCRRRPETALAVGLVVGPMVVLYSFYLFWSGDWAWGPRYLLFALPALLLPVADVIERSVPLARTVRAGIAAVLLTGASVQCLGNAFYWDDFINISRQAQQAWLGRPNTHGTPLEPYPCFSCFEQVYGVQWLPPMNPIGGHLWLLRHQVRGDDWRTAEADAPWKRYTSLTLDIQESYESASIDWWPFAAEPRRRPVVALAALMMLLAVPWRPWLRALRAPNDDGTPPRG